MALDTLSIRDLLREVCPEAQGATDQTLDIFIEMATLRLSASVFGDLYRPAVVYLAAHFYIMTQRRDGNAGAITFQRAGEVSENRGGIAMDASGYNQTSYGNLYLELRRSRHKVKPMSTFPGSRF
jgi:hypothetical protein